MAKRTGWNGNEASRDERQAPCDCFPLARRGPAGDSEIYCPKCGLVFRKSTDSQSDAAGEPAP